MTSPTTPLRVRFAPSPTGLMHVGHLRAALPNVLLATKTGATLILRFEDSDFQRNKIDSEPAIFEDLTWLGFTFAEGPHVGGPVAPYRTIERADRGDYTAAVQKLMDMGRAYECFTTPEELDLLRKVQTMKGEPPRYDNRHRDLTDAQKAAFRAEGRQPVIRFRLSDEDIVFQDLIRGEQRFKPENLGGDPVIVRSTGLPLFTFYGCVDDIAMGITHVIRGEDHITNAAIQIQMYKAFGATPPQFAHIPLMLDAEGHKMSKRLGGLSIRQLRQGGYLPQAILSYMSGLGLAEAARPGATLTELAAAFDFARCGKAPVRFDEEQLAHTNMAALHVSTWADISIYATAFIPETISVAQMESLWPMLREGLNTLADIPTALAPLTQLPAKQEFSATDRAFIEVAVDALPTPFTPDTWKQWTDALKATTGRKGKDLFMPLRRALTGAEHGPDMASLLPFWGEATTRARIAAALGQ